MKKIEIDTYSYKAKIINRVILPSSFWIRTARKLGEAVARFPYEYEELMVHVSNKIKLLDVIRDKRSTALGRFLNRFAQEESEFIVLDGVVIKQLFDLIGETPPMEVDVRSSYRIPHEDVRSLYKAVKNQPSPSNSEKSE